MKNKKQILKSLLISCVLFFLTLSHAVSMDVMLEQDGIGHGITRTCNEKEVIFHEENYGGLYKQDGIVKKYETSWQGYYNQNKKYDSENKELRAALFGLEGISINMGSLSAYMNHKNKAEELYHLPVWYYCHMDSTSYSSIDSIGIAASNGQNLISEDWRRGTFLSFKEYKTGKEGRLSITKSMFPLKLEIKLICSKQPLEILRDRIYNNSRNTHLSSLKTWAGEEPLIFTFEEPDFFDQSGRLKISGLLINSLAPGDITVPQAIEWEE